MKKSHGAKLLFLMLPSFLVASPVDNNFNKVNYKLQESEKVESVSSPLITLKGYLEDGTPILERKFIASLDELTPILKKAIIGMHKGEKRKVLINQSKDTKKNIIYEIEILQTDKTKIKQPTLASIKKIR